MLAEGPISTADRPWLATPEELERHRHWADFAAWERWMALYLDEPLNELADEDGVMDRLNGVQQAHLYNLMARLADGDAPATPSPRKADSHARLVVRPRRAGRLAGGGAAAEEDLAVSNEREFVNCPDCGGDGECPLCAGHGTVTPSLRELRLAVVRDDAERDRLRAEVERLARLNADKFAHIQAYCRAADEDRAEIARLRAAVQHARGYFLAHAGAAGISADPRERERADHLRHHAAVMDAALNPRPAEAPDV